MHCKQDQPVHCSSWQASGIFRFHLPCLSCHIHSLRALQIYQFRGCDDCDPHIHKEVTFQWMNVKYPPPQTPWHAGWGLEWRRG